MRPLGSRGELVSTCGDGSKYSSITTGLGLCQDRSSGIPLRICGAHVAASSDPWRGVRQPWRGVRQPWRTLADSDCADRHAGDSIPDPRRVGQLDPRTGVTVGPSEHCCRDLASSQWRHYRIRAHDGHDNRVGDLLDVGLGSNPTHIRRSAPTARWGSTHPISTCSNSADLQRHPGSGVI